MISGKVEDEVYDEEDEAEESASGIGRGMGAARETVGGEGRGACERGRRGLLAGVRGEEDGGAGGDMVVAICGAGGKIEWWWIRARRSTRSLEKIFCSRQLSVC